MADLIVSNQSFTASEGMPTKKDIEAFDENSEISSPASSVNINPLVLASDRKVLGVVNRNVAESSLNQNYIDTTNGSSSINMNKPPKKESGNYSGYSFMFDNKENIPPKLPNNPKSKKKASSLRRGLLRL